MITSFAELVNEIRVKKERAERALQDPHITELMKQRVLLPEFQICVLALEGAKVFQKERERQGLLDTDPVTAVGRQTL